MVNNRLNNSTQKLSNAWGSAIALALTALLLPACSTPQREATAPAPATPGTVATTTENVVDRTAELLGKTVTVRSKPINKLSPSTFTISDQKFFGSKPILVVNATGKPFALPAESGQDIQVTGTVRNFVLADIEREYKLSLQPNQYADYENKPAIVAQSMALAPTPGELTSNPQKYYGKTLAVSGKVDSIKSPNSFTLDENKLIGGEDLLVIHTVPKTSVKEDDKVAVTGVLRQFVVAELDREYDLQWDLTLKQKLEAEYTNKPVLVATGVYPSDIPD
ncbi:hypothetical protein IQ269_22340 [Tychonema sp. LEGE 07199]|uniref:hypothetical protein n=1 Tax=unclassified Tychonema TaxID=2642144 RepID=UPI00188302C1|nr:MULTISPECIES: hypothetical protein [unclassified Tychonema]MBE9123461.1 hypothetical protein [Tychonema sp. LEGE 07199]MBE9132365.1 hypothetical protein [Tychonema sp. LEGE 07196]